MQCSGNVMKMYIQYSMLQYSTAQYSIVSKIQLSKQ